MKNSQKLSYQDAGVNIDRANAFVDHIRALAGKTRRSGVLAGIGGFGALFEIPQERFKRPILVSGTDGVGTKLKLAVALNRHDTIGIDLVAMCANDIACLGAEPLFFLDYFATGKLNTEQAQAIITGIVAGCELAGAALIGGETAEMPGVYQGEDYDLAGFCVGAVEKDNIIDGSNVQVGDLVIGLASSGPHSNGYSLIRYIIEKNHTNLQQPFGDATLGETLLTPTRIYVPALLALNKTVKVHALAHITGGGLTENLPRVLPKYTQALLKRDRWEWPPIFQWLQQAGNLDEQEMMRTFNLGIGMVAIISPNELDTARDLLKAAGEKTFLLGQIQSSSVEKPSVQWS